MLFSAFSPPRMLSDKAELSDRSDIAQPAVDNHKALLCRAGAPAQRDKARGASGSEKAGPAPTPQLTGTAAPVDAKGTAGGTSERPQHEAAHTHAAAAAVASPGALIGHASTSTAPLTLAEASPFSGRAVTRALSSQRHSALPEPAGTVLSPSASMVQRLQRLQDRADEGCLTELSQMYPHWLPTRAISIQQDACECRNRDSLGLHFT